MLLITPHHGLRNLFTIAIILRVIVDETAASESLPRNSDVIESLAEEHPYIVALLQCHKQYICTGAIINKVTVITSGRCVIRGPKYVAVGAAVLRKDITRHQLYRVSATKLHAEYIYRMTPKNSNTTRIHNNIGLVFVAEPVLEYCFPGVEMAHSYASELNGKEMRVVGFGYLRGLNVVALQSQTYRQMACANPKWYYCVCGLEHSTQAETYEDRFGEGAPVMLGSRLVGITAAPCGLLTIPALGTKFNIFTVLGSYEIWINREKSQGHTDRIQTCMRSLKNKKVRLVIWSKYVYVLIVISGYMIFSQC